MKYIKNRCLDRIKELRNKALAYLLKNNIPLNEWERFTGLNGNEDEGMNDIYVNGLSVDEKTELIMYGYYTGDEFFEIQRDSYLESKYSE